MRAAILFPSDYFDPSLSESTFAEEYKAVCAIDNFDALLFNYEDYRAGGSLRIQGRGSDCAELLIYRGWMLKPEQYARLYNEASREGFKLLTSPKCYELMHCFPQAAQILEGQNVSYRAYPITNGSIHIDTRDVNATFERFMVKDYVKFLSVSIGAWSKSWLRMDSGLCVVNR